MFASTGRCKEHASKSKGRKRRHYEGNVPKSLLRPIRAGLLQSVDIDPFVTLIATLEPIPSQCIAAMDPVTAALATARGHVESIIAGNYTHVQLLDSVFWGDDTVTRKDGRRYVHPPRPKKRPAPDGDEASGPAPVEPLDVARTAAVQRPASEAAVAVGDNEPAHAPLSKKHRVSSATTGHSHAPTVCVVDGTTTGTAARARRPQRCVARPSPLPRLPSEEEEEGESNITVLENHPSGHGTEMPICSDDGLPVPLVVRDFRSPPWGPVWRGGPVNDYQRQNMTDFIDDRRPDGSKTYHDLAYILDGDCISVWPAVCRLLLDLPCPLSPWVIDPLHRGWYTEILSTFLNQCIDQCSATGKDQFVAVMRFICASLEHRDGGLEAAIGALEAANTSVAPPIGPQPGGADWWPSAPLHAARMRVQRIGEHRVCAFRRRLRSDVGPMWPVVAQLVLGLPYPVGEWRLRKHHLDHCRDVLRSFTHNVCGGMFVKPHHCPDMYHLYNQLRSSDLTTEDMVNIIQRLEERHKATCVI